MDAQQYLIDPFCCFERVGVTTRLLTDNHSYNRQPVADGSE
jgi:hypothetical protein